MEDSSFFSNSSKYRKRKPIFAKDEHSPVAKLNGHLSRCSSQHALPNRNSPLCLTQTNPTIITRPIQATPQVIRMGSSSNAAIRVNYSQPKVNAVVNHILYTTRPATPVINILPPQKSINHQPLQTTPYVAPQQNFYQTMPATSTLHHTSHHLHQTQPVTMTKVQRRSRAVTKENFEEDFESGIVTLRPAVVAIQRVMKEVGSNHVEKEVTYLTKEQGECSPNFNSTPSASNSLYSSVTTPLNVPSASSSFSVHTSQLTPSRLKACSEDVQINKLSEINSLLTQNYNLLYNEFFNLKKEIREEQVVEERTFLQRSVNQIEAIFALQTNQALAKMEEVYRSTKNTLKKGFKPKNEIKMKDLFP